MFLQNNNKGKVIEAEKLYQAGIDTLGYEKPQVAIILFKEAASLGHKEAAKFVKILTGSKDHVSS